MARHPATYLGATFSAEAGMCLEVCQVPVCGAMSSGCTQAFVWLARLEVGR